MRLGQKKLRKSGNKAKFGRIIEQTQSLVLHLANHLSPLFMNMTKFFAAVALVSLGLTACGDVRPSDAAGAAIKAESMNLETFRTAQNIKNVEKLSLNQVADLDLSQIKAEAIMLKSRQAAKAEQADAAVAANTYLKMMAAEQKAASLELNFTMSEEPIENGVFLFGLESKSSQELSLEVFDEEGFALAANNKLNLNEGNNYKALNVSSLEKGSYLIRLRDAEGRELKRTLNIAK